MSVYSTTPLPDDIPAIEPVAVGGDRPKWSVMIPAYNCARYLRETLASVLEQDPGPTRMQIEVVDDFSTKDDPEEVVREVGGGRVAFFRQPQNVGIARNFNTCVRRSRGELAHILHGDDLVLPGFYRRLEELAALHPQRGLLNCLGLLIDHDGNVNGVSPRVIALEQGSDDPAPYFYSNPFLTPCVVLRRSVYERIGGFNQTWNHVSDWEMWLRAIAHCGGVSLSQPLAKYRAFPSNHSSQLTLSGENIREHWQCGVSLANRYPGFSLERWRQIVGDIAEGQMLHFKSAKNRSAYRANQAVWREMRTSRGQALFHLKDAARSLIRIMRRL